MNGCNADVNALFQRGREKVKGLSHLGREKHLTVSLAGQEGGKACVRVPFGDVR